MTDVGNLVGLAIRGGLFEGDALLSNPPLIAVATSKKALGIKLNRLRVYFENDVPHKHSNGRLLNVVISGPYLLTDVKVITRGQLDEIEIPKKVFELLLCESYPSRRVIVFENKDGDRIYVFATMTTLLENVIDEIYQKHLPKHLRKARKNTTKP